MCSFDKGYVNTEQDLDSAIDNLPPIVDVMLYFICFAQKLQIFDFASLQFRLEDNSIWNNFFTFVV